MKQMTTAEFQKANLSTLEGPVEVRRYTKRIGAYYPDGYTPSELEPTPAWAGPTEGPALNIESPRVAELEEEVARLKRELAARPSKLLPPPVTNLAPTTTNAVAGTTTVTQPTPVRTDDPFLGLAKQDRDFFDRKSRGPKK